MPRVRKSQEELKEHIRIYQREYARTPKSQRTRRNRDLKKHYGITIEDYEFILKYQGGVCAICKDPPKNNRTLCVDHNHDTGQIRGLLCDNCNVCLGWLELLPKKIQYKYEELERKYRELEKSVNQHKLKE